MSHNLTILVENVKIRKQRNWEERRNRMNILAVGDIVGEIGVKKLKEELPKIKKEENIDDLMAKYDEPTSSSNSAIDDELAKLKTKLGLDK